MRTPSEKLTSCLAPGKPTKTTTLTIKYCSDRCRSRRTNPLDRRIEETFVALLNGADPASLASETANTAPQAPLKQDSIAKKKPAKGDKRILVPVEDVETIIFGSRFNPEKTHGRRRNKAKRTLGPDEVEDDDMDHGNVRQEEKEQTLSADVTSQTDGTASVPATDDEAYLSENSISGGVPLNLPDRSRPSQGHTARQDELKEFAAKDFGAGKVRPGQLETELNFSAMGGERGWAEKLEETDEMREKRLAGEKRAREREQVRCAARRLVAFGWTVPVEDDTNDAVAKTTKRKSKKGKRATDDEEEEVVDKDGKGQKTLQKKCEAIMAGVAVEASYAKGPFAIRWREYKSGPLATA